MDEETRKENKVTLIDQSRLSITGVSKIISISNELLVLDVFDKSLSVAGSDIEVSRLDVEMGTIEATGTFDSFKYSNPKDKTNIFKKIFK